MSKPFPLLVAGAFFPATLQAQTAQTIGLQSFYAWWMLLAGAVFSLVFYSLWRLKQSEQAKARIEGIGWFSAALAVWSVSGLFEVLVLSGKMPLGGAAGIPLFRSLFSTCNSVFILFVIPSVEIKSDASALLKNIVGLSKSKLGVALGGIFVVAVTMLLFGLCRLFKLSDTSPLWRLLSIPDILFSLFTILALLLVFRAAFRDEKRRMSLMVWVVYATILLTGFAEIGQTFPMWTALGLPAPAYFSEVFSGETQAYFIFYNLVAVVFKMLLIVLFVILLYSYEIKKAEEHRLEELLSDEEIKQNWGLDAKEIIVLRRLARGDTREQIGSDELLFPPKKRANGVGENAPRTLPRKNVDDLLQNKIAPKLRLPNRESYILMFALQNRIVPFGFPTDRNFSENFTGENASPE
jgi:hypothetical protein